MNEIQTPFCTLSSPFPIQSKMTSCKNPIPQKKKTTLRPLKDFHSDWLHRLRTNLLPNLHRSLSSSYTSPSSSSPIIIIPGNGAILSTSDLLSAQVSSMYSHFQAYYHALDLVSRHDVTQLLAPEWRSPIENPFLWFEDFHPSLFTNLLRTLSPSQTLVTKIERLERGIRLMVPSINSRFNNLQKCFLEKIVSKEWEEDEMVMVRGHVENMESVFWDVNRLRRSILSEIVGAADVYQAAMFLEKLAEFVVGFSDQDLIHEFQQSTSS